MGTPLCIPSQQGIELGRIASMELNHVSVTTAKQGQSVAMKIEPTNATESSRLYGRHFDLQVSPSCLAAIAQDTGRLGHAAGRMGSVLCNDAMVDFMLERP